MAFADIIKARAETNGLALVVLASAATPKSIRRVASRLGAAHLPENDNDLLKEHRQALRIGKTTLPSTLPAAQTDASAEANPVEMSRRHLLSTRKAAEERYANTK